MTTASVLVTGGSGFIAGHCILQLLEQGYEVRTTVRSLDREGAVRRVLESAGMTRGDHLTFVAADLLADAGWDAAVAGCAYVLHVASPVQPGHVENADDLIVPAREGTLRVLRAAERNEVQRVVMTSAFHAVSWGHPHDGRVFTEADWSDLDGPGVDAYGKSKTLAERAAWDFFAGRTSRTELVTMLPVAVMGPIMGTDVSGSNHLVQEILSGGMPAFPHLYIPIVDVRDVAHAHCLAMTATGAGGQRFLLSNGPALPMARIGSIIREQLGADATKVPTRTVPNLVIRLASIVNKEFRTIVPDLGYAKKTSNEYARQMLGWQPRPAEEAVLAAARSIVTEGLVHA